MPKIYSSREIIKNFTKYWFKKITQKWSHLKMKKLEKTIIIPIHNKDIPLWTFKSILEQADISYETFLNIK
jgi:predicted RNA binding protein YcfA (HicA-like mRNA interferase family)